MDQKLFGISEPRLTLLRKGNQPLRFTRALQAAYHEPIVQERLKSLDPRYIITGDASEYFRVYKAMGIMEMLTGQTPDSRPSNDFPWRSSGSTGGEYTAASSFDPLSYSPTILHTADKKTRPITRSNQDMYYLLDCRICNSPCMIAHFGWPKKIRNFIRFQNVRCRFAFREARFLGLDKSAAQLVNTGT